MSTTFRELDAFEIDLIFGAERSDAWGSIAAGFGTIALGVAIPLATGGLATPGGIALVAAGVTAIHIGVAQLALEKN